MNKDEIKSTYIFVPKIADCALQVFL